MAVIGMIILIILFSVCTAMLFTLVRYNTRTIPPAEEVEYYLKSLFIKSFLAFLVIWSFLVMILCALYLILK